MLLSRTLEGRTGTIGQSCSWGDRYYPEAYSDSPTSNVYVYTVYTIQRMHAGKLTSEDRAVDIPAVQLPYHEPELSNHKSSSTLDCALWSSSNRYNLMILHGWLLRRPILQKVIKLWRVRAQPLRLKVANSLSGDFNLEANDISVSDLTLREGLVLRIHELDHARFDFLVRDAKSGHRVG